MIDRPRIAGLLEETHGLAPDFVTEFFDRLDDSYFASVSVDSIVSDARQLARLAHPGSIRFHADLLDSGMVCCTIYAFDFPGLFSLICGLLAVSGFDINSGTIHTYRYASETRTVVRRRQGRVRRFDHEIPRPRRIIDRFIGTIDSPGSFSTWHDRFSRLVTRAWSSITSTGTGKVWGVDDARRFVYETVSRTLVQRRLDADHVLYPVTISVGTAPSGGTRLTVLTEDTPFFLFALGTAVALQEISIESVRIHTSGRRVEDEIDISDIGGGPLEDPERIDRIKLSILFTKQFTYFLGTAPDPEAALERFESLCNSILSMPSSAALQHLLSNPSVLRDLARVLGASDFLWEEFVRVQYESLLPMLERTTRMEELSHDGDTIDSLLDAELAHARGFDEKRRRINDFKNREIYLIDLDHIVNPDRDFFFLSTRLTRLAEVVIARAVDVAYEELEAQFGQPTGFAGLPAEFSVLGLGKFGGEALGYASDIELMFVYSDTGSTLGGSKSISNADFFERCFRSATSLIEAKQEGIFHIDLRLRPFGKSAPLAVSVDSFCNYYGVGGAAHSFERLALIRMRAVAGDSDLGARIERLRDEMVYATDSIDHDELRRIRQRQFAEKQAGRRLNAKFSPGALVDLEYSVQIIQCRHGGRIEALRTPRIHVALEELVGAGILGKDESTQLVDAYQFLRRLINGLRMLRGSAKDLFLPDSGSTEYSHLARRMGYAEEGDMSASQRLHIDFQIKTALVRHFVEQHLGRQAIPGESGGNAADLVLSDSMPADRRNAIIASGGLTNISRANAIISRLREEPATRPLFARLAVLAWDVLPGLPDPDMALNNWDRYLASLDDQPSHFRQLLAQPLMLEVLFDVFAGSQFLADSLVANPGFLDWVADPDRLHRLRDRTELEHELATVDSGIAGWMEEARTIRKRELLRVGTRDLCLGVPLRDIVEELSIIADTFVASALGRAWESEMPDATIDETGFCVYAFGKLGGRELNYSSDIDLLATFREVPTGVESEAFPARMASVMETMRSLLSDYTPAGYIYRVDYRLRPYGRSGSLVVSEGAIRDYYRTDASPWERQALLKLRPIAGHMPSGRRLTDQLHAGLTDPTPSSVVRRELADLRDEAIRTHASALRGIDIKNGRGGIRDIEFLVQGMQVETAPRYADVITGNTLTAIERLRRRGVLVDDASEALRDDYIFLRRIEHFLQLLEDQQVHALPKREQDRAALARRLFGAEARACELDARIEETTARVRERFDAYVSG